jgi:uncharacterized protein YuzE
VRFHYYPETDSLYLDLTETPSLDSREVAPGVVLDFGANGRLVGIDVDQASKFVNLSHLEAEALPMASFSWLAGQTRTSSVLEPGGKILHEPGADYAVSSDEDTSTS